ncbi:WSC domain-containing protein [Fusarium oxysporum f. sp. albedinis]|nr:WSC domain-containing protein [Fusarium oxysporum f. sp. albedinis]
MPPVTYKTTSAFFVDPKTKTGKGPWKSSIDYYGDLSTTLFRSAYMPHLSMSRQFLPNPCKDSLYLIIGVLDFDGVMEAPIEVTAHYPVLTGLNRELPVGVQTRPTAIERIKRTEPRLREYKYMLEAAEGKMGNNDS